ncbi:MAG: VCBS repeat-containing protein [bacterium]|nr:VCBS repeat-containing protein [bacterium]
MLTTVCSAVTLLTPATCPQEPTPPRFEAAVAIATPAGPVRLEQPGFAAPCLFDVDGDGRRDLVVGQFAGGKIKIYRSTGQAKFAAGKWLEVGGKPAEVPGVW